MVGTSKGTVPGTRPATVQVWHHIPGTVPGTYLVLIDSENGCPDGPREPPKKKAPLPVPDNVCILILTLSISMVR
jgi:hypothetical protein